jgi:hypothetical protein
MSIPEERRDEFPEERRDEFPEERQGRNLLKLPGRFQQADVPHSPA